MGSNGGIEDRLGDLQAPFGLDNWWFNGFNCWKQWDRELDRCEVIHSDCWTTAWSLGWGLDDNLSNFVVCSGELFVCFGWVTSLSMDLDWVSYFLIPFKTEG